LLLLWIRRRKTAFWTVDRRPATSKRVGPLDPRMTHFSESRGLARCLVLVAMVIVGACRSDPEPGPLDPRPVHTKQTWVAMVNGEVIGQVVLLEIEDPAGRVRFHRALNRSGQWLGYIDAQQRVFRREPFAEREVFVGVYPMDEGLALLYERAEPVQIVPLDEFEAREAAHTREQPHGPTPPDQENGPR
jgi:hypothetical protein